MDSLPTSSMHFLDLAGNYIDEPAEWTSALVELFSPDWEEAVLIRQHIHSSEDLPISRKKIGGLWRVVADWPRSDSGHYRIVLSIKEQKAIERIVTVNPRKINLDAYVWMLEDLDTRLPAAIAVALQRTGALAGLHFLPPGQSTREQEVARLRRAIKGSSNRIGLVQVLKNLTHEPHQVFGSKEVWVSRKLARRPHPARLALAMARPHNMDTSGIPLQVLDTRVEPISDTYENRLIKVYYDLVYHRLRRIILILENMKSNEQHFHEAKILLDELERARRVANFLDEVTLPAYLPTQITMVLLKRPVYRAALEGYLEFKQSPTVRFEDVVLEAPLKNLPHLYQVWGTLNVFTALLNVAADQGYKVIREQLAKRDALGVYIQLLPNGDPILELFHPTRGTTVKLTRERTYGKTGELRSSTHSQRPDIAVEILTSTKHWHVYIFDPKYKLENEKKGEDSKSTEPQKEDIDKMHVYRDAICDKEGKKVVEYAAILYPGESKSYPREVKIEALKVYPEAEAVKVLEKQLYKVLSRALML